MKVYLSINLHLSTLNCVIFSSLHLFNCLPKILKDSTASVPTILPLVLTYNLRLSATGTNTGLTRNISLDKQLVNMNRCFFSFNFS